MTDGARHLDATLAAYAAELVRWNRQINLVSRQDTAHRVEALVAQCRIAGEDLLRGELATWPDAASVLYFDLGSGGGLPGVVWHHLLAARFAKVRSWLVEPREKRAWFLGRQAATAGAGLRVWAGRWGEGEGEGPEVDPAPAGKVLISLKALHLPDPVVLSGWEASCHRRPVPAGTEVVIARFYPPEQTWTSALAADLGAEDPLHETHAPDLIYRALRRRVVAPGPDGSASLVISAYEAAPRA